MTLQRWCVVAFLVALIGGGCTYASDRDDAASFLAVWTVEYRSVQGNRTQTQ